MKKIEIKADKDGVKGSLFVLVPSEKQRRRYAGELSINYGAGANSDPEKNLKAAERLDEIVNSHVKSVNIELDSGEKFKSYFDMQEDSDLDELCKKAQDVILNGSLGES